MMAKAAASPILQLIRQVVEDGKVRELPDRDLLQRFHAQQDQAAFHALLRRHGPMVLDVCRGVLGDGPDAEDAFQAAFLALAQKAGSIRKGASVGSWLHGVVHRTALKARAQSAVRQRHEGRAPQRQTSETDDPSWREVRQVLHDELGGISERYREPLVLCYLEGATQKRAAARLGLAERTVRERLERGRELLRVRLVGRGLGPAAILAAAAWPAATVSASVPAVLADSTVKAATFVAAGGAATSVVSARVAALTQGVLRTMLLTKLKVTLAALVIAGLLASGVLVASLCTEPAKPASALAKAVLAKPGDDKKAQPAQKPAGPGTLLLSRDGSVVALTPDGKEGDALIAPQGARTTFHSRLSPDGTRAAFAVNKGERRGPGDDLNAPWPFQVVIRKLGAADPTAVADFSVKRLLTLCWAPDGKKVLVTNDTGGDGALENVLVDAESGKTEPIELPANVRVLDWSGDGKTFLVLYQAEKKYRLGLAAKGEKEARELTELKVRFATNVVARFSPDGKQVLFTDADPEQKDAYKWHRSSNPHLLDVATRKREPLAEFPDNAQCLGLAWSPDGKRVAYTWTQLHPDLLRKDEINIADEKETEAFLIVADADGKNARTVTSAKSGHAITMILGSIDWR
jgi:RNA polymerase sigma factor (sigma-70 family)